MNTDTIEIKEASPFSAEISTVSQWLSKTWSFDLGYALSETEEWCNELAGARTETLLVGKLGHRIVGALIVCKCDLEGYEHLTPWISSLYVAEEFRGRNFGDQLLKEACLWAIKQGKRDLFLYADEGKLIGYYHGLGWRNVEDVLVNGETCQIMKKTLVNLSHSDPT